MNEPICTLSPTGLTLMFLGAVLTAAVAPLGILVVIAGGALLVRHEVRRQQYAAAVRRQREHDKYAPIARYWNR